MSLQNAAARSHLQGPAVPLLILPAIGKQHAAVAGKGIPDIPDAHAARTAIDEEGVTAAAYTLISIEATSAAVPEDEIDFVLDRPFLFAVTGSDGLPLFTGIVNEPRLRLLYCRRKICCLFIKDIRNAKRFQPFFQFKRGCHVKFRHCEINRSMLLILPALSG